jgi:hypothetical protein
MSVFNNSYVAVVWQCTSQFLIIKVILTVFIKLNLNVQIFCPAVHITIPNQFEVYRNIKSKKCKFTKLNEGSEDVTSRAVPDFGYGRKPATFTNPAPAKM